MTLTLRSRCSWNRKLLCVAKPVLLPNRRPHRFRCTNPVPGRSCTPMFILIRVKLCAVLWGKPSCASRAHRVGEVSLQRIPGPASHQTTKTFKLNAGRGYARRREPQGTSPETHPRRPGRGSSGSKVLEDDVFGNAVRAFGASEIMSRVSQRYLQSDRSNHVSHPR